MTRTRDLRITNALLYQLSYSSTYCITNANCESYYITKQIILQVFEHIFFFAQALFSLQLKNSLPFIKEIFFLKVVKALLMCYNDLV